MTTDNLRLLLDFMSKSQVRLTYKDRWLIVDDNTSHYLFTVYSRQMYQKNTRTLYEGLSLEEAIKILEGE